MYENQNQAVFFSPTTEHALLSGAAVRSHGLTDLFL